LIKLTNYNNEDELLEKLAIGPAIPLLSNLAKLLRATKTGKMFGGIRQAYRGGGLSKALAQTARYRDPLSYLAKPLAKTRGVVPTGLYRGSSRLFNPGRTFRTFLGNIAYSGQVLGKGVAQKGVLAPFQLAKNIGTLAKQQLRAAPLKKVDLTQTATRGKWFKQGVIDVGGKKYWKSWSPWSKRKIVGTTGGEGIIKKRALTRPLAYATTGPGFGALVYASGDKEKSKAQRAAAGLGESALWTAAPGLAGAYYLAKMPKDIIGAFKPKKIEDIKPY